MDGKAPLSLPPRAGREEPPVISCECPAFLIFPDNVRECKWGGVGYGKEMVTSGGIQDKGHLASPGSS